METKRCIACGEEILVIAKLCKHCNVEQTDARFIEKPTPKVVKSSSNSESSLVKGTEGNPTKFPKWAISTGAILAIVVVGYFVINSSLGGNPSSNEVHATSDSSAQAGQELLSLMDASAAKIETDGVTETWIMDHDTEDPLIDVFDPTNAFPGTRIAQSSGGESWASDDTRSDATYVRQSFSMFFPSKKDSAELISSASTAKMIDESTYTAELGKGINAATYTFEVTDGLISKVTVEYFDTSFEIDEFTFEYGRTAKGDEILRTAKVPVGDY